MKAHIGSDDARGLVHRVEGTAANVSDISQASVLLHGEEKRAGVDAGCTGVEKRPEIVALGRQIEWRVAARRGALKAQPEGWAIAIGGAWEKLTARARALVEHPFHIVKNIFGHRKARYRGPGEKHGATAGALCAGQPLHGASAVDGRRSLSATAARQKAGKTRG